jgi:hypothetical protein
MANLRQIQVNLEQSVNDRVNQALGFREWAVQIPHFGDLQPRPEVKQANPRQFSEAAIANFLDVVGQNGIPNALFNIFVSRNIPESVINTGNYWVLQRDDQEQPMNCIVLQKVIKDDRFIVTVGVVKTDVYQPLF